MKKHIKTILYRGPKLRFLLVKLPSFCCFPGEPQLLPWLHSAACGGGEWAGAGDATQRQGWDPSRCVWVKLMGYTGIPLWTHTNLVISYDFEAF